MHPIPPLRRLGRGALVLLALVGLASCSDGPDLLAPDFLVELDVRVEVASEWVEHFDASGIEEVRVTVASAESGDTLVSYRGPLPPGDGAWTVPVELDHPAGPVDVSLEVELLSSGGVEWSGRTSTGKVRATFHSATVALYRGPLANLGVTDVQILNAPTEMDEGTEVQLSADVTSDDADPPTVFWTSSDPDVAAVDGTGSVTGVSPGTAAISAVAGPAGDTAVIMVEIIPDAVLIEPSATVLTSLGDVLLVQGAIVGSQGDTLPDLTLRWASTDSTVLRPVDDGSFEAMAEGEAEIIATVVERPEVQGSVMIEVDQVVATVSLTPTDTILGPGASTSYVAVAMDANGHPVPDAVVQWSSSSASVATIDSDGVASAAGQGETVVQAEVEGVVASTRLTVLGVAGVTRIWIGGAAGGPRDWANQDNWLPRLRPTLVDTVLVEASAAELPTLTANQSVADLIVEDGATLELAGFQLTVTDDLDAGNTLIGPGVVRMIGDDGTLSGSIPELLVHGVVSAVGDVVVAGDLTVSGAGRDLVVGPHDVSVAGDLLIQEGGVVTMTDPAGVLAASGQAVFDGGSTTGRLTAGELRVGGNFTAWTAEPRAFAPSGAHRTILDGDVIQTVYLHHNAQGESGFHLLELDNPGGATLASTVRVATDVVLVRGTLGGAQTMVIGGDLQEVQGGNQYQVLNTTFTGQPALPSSLQTTATFTASFVLGADLELAGSLIVSGPGASFDVGARTVDVSGDVTTEADGTLVMQNPAGTLDVGGEVFLDGGSTMGLLTAGTLRVAGNFTAWTSHPLNYAPTGSHSTVLDGVTAQGVYLHHSGVDESRFRSLEVANPAGVTLFQTTRVTDDVVMTQGTLGGQQTMYIGGDLVELLGGNQYQVLNTTFTGTPALPASVQSNVTFSGPHTLTQDLAVLGDVMVVGTGADLSIGSNTLSVDGDFRTLDGGTLTMQEAGLLDVEGEVEFNGASTLGDLTDGELRVAGNFTAWTSHPENFAPTGSHRTVLDGDATQSIYLHHSGLDQSRFRFLEVTNPTGVTVLGTTRVTGDLDVATVLAVEPGQSTLVGGLFRLESAATLYNDGSVQANACEILGTVVGNAVVCP